MALSGLRSRSHLPPGSPAGRFTAVTMTGRRVLLSGAQKLQFGRASNGPLDDIDSAISADIARQPVSGANYSPWRAERGASRQFADYLSDGAGAFCDENSLRLSIRCPSST